MRIVALPLTRPSPSHRPTTFYSFKIVPPPPPPPPPASTEPPPPPGWLPPEGVVKWATLKVDKTWGGWGKAKEGSWKFRVFEFGERFLDRLDFEEAALKRIDVKSAPPARVPPELAGEERAEAEAAWGRVKVPLFYPPSVLSAPTALSDLQTLLQQRIPLHTRGFYTYLLLAPLTAPFMLIPIIPNLPFFFCAWRAWSHYQALRGARRVDALLQAGKIAPEADAALDAVYPPIISEPAPAGGPDPDPDMDMDAGARARQALIVTRDSLGNAMRALEMKEDEAKDVLRAYEQTINRAR
ncbi:mitochondrial K+-H+ exchange-related-domain-containing protein [Mycena belliarum]|uniref:Mitochondrial K+-H+ exchange-related-domain-containing protein n=1 Tax=Mycena belliarum TaxID=1033014 RepID=A0AAD6UEJ4_9AGAR|nr:mitochondrial K+-H+ exchange-related-domain-containing protein [Mycena belliae]